MAKILNNKPLTIVLLLIVALFYPALGTAMAIATACKWCYDWGIRDSKNIEEQ